MKFETPFLYNKIFICAGTTYKRRAVRPLILHPALKRLVWLWVVPREERRRKIKTCWNIKHSPIIAIKIAKQGDSTHFAFVKSITALCRLSLDSKNLHEIMSKTYNSVERGQKHHTWAF